MFPWFDILTAAPTVDFDELTWTPSIMSQAEDRAHSISQQNCVNVCFLYDPDIIDVIIFQMLILKSDVVTDADVVDSKCKSL